MSDLNLATDVYQLSPDEIERWDSLYEVRGGFDEIIQSNATQWLEELMPLHGTTEACRWDFLRTSFPQYDSEEFRPKDISEFPSVLRYLCMRTEEAANALNQKRSKGGNKREG